MIRAFLAVAPIIATSLAMYVAACAWCAHMDRRAARAAAKAKHPAGRGLLTIDEPMHGLSLDEIRALIIARAAVQEIDTVDDLVREWSR